jgi:hypothetical protein
VRDGAVVRRNWFSEADAEIEAKTADGESEAGRRGEPGGAGARRGGGRRARAFARRGLGVRSDGLRTSLDLARARAIRGFVVKLFAGDA